MRSKIKELRIKNKGLNDILTQIVEKKREDLAIQKKEISLVKLKEFVSNLNVVKNQFKDAILNAKGMALIAEIKLASPSDKTLKSDVDIMDRASEYENAGADALSFITEKHFFKGDVSDIVKLRAKVDLPVLQKDFVIDEYQIYEAKIVGSNAILLIAKLVVKKKLREFVDLSKALGIEPVVEINDEKDLKKALGTAASVIAVNARNLDTFEIDVDKACGLLQKIPSKYLNLGFSGVNSSVEVKKYQDSGANGVLVGTSLMKAQNINEFIKELRSI